MKYNVSGCAEKPNKRQDMEKTMNNIHNSHEPPDFSLVLGGQLFQLLVRCRLDTPAQELVKRRIVFISMFAWLPLLLLSLVNG